MMNFARQKEVVCGLVIAIPALWTFLSGDFGTEAVGVKSFVWPACFGEKCGGSTFFALAFTLGRDGRDG
jgi:hypothetical protein